MQHQCYTTNYYYYCSEAHAMGLFSSKFYLIDCTRHPAPYREFPAMTYTADCMAYAVLWAGLALIDYLVDVKIGTWIGNIGVCCARTEPYWRSLMLDTPVTSEQWEEFDRLFAGCNFKLTYEAPLRGPEHDAKFPWLHPAPGLVTSGVILNHSSYHISDIDYNHQCPNRSPGDPSCPHAKMCQALVGGHSTESTLSVDDMRYLITAFGAPVLVKEHPALINEEWEMMHLLLRSNRVHESSDDSGSGDSTAVTPQPGSPSERALRKFHQRYDSSRIKAIDCISIQSLVHDYIVIGDSVRRSAAAGAEYRPFFNRCQWSMRWGTPAPTSAPRADKSACKVTSSFRSRTQHNVSHTKSAKSRKQEAEMQGHDQRSLTSGEPERRKDV